MKFAIAILPHVFPLRPDPALLDAAHHWAETDAHAELRDRLEAEFDGFAVTVRFRGGIEHPEVWRDESAVLWSHLAPHMNWQLAPVRTTIATVIRSPRPARYAPATATATQDLLHRGETTMPDEWTRWVLAHLGAHPVEDTVVDYFTRQPVPAFTTMLPLEDARS